MYLLFLPMQHLEKLKELTINFAETHMYGKQINSPTIILDPETFSLLGDNDYLILLYKAFLDDDHFNFSSASSTRILYFLNDLAMRLNIDLAWRQINIPHFRPSSGKAAQEWICSLIEIFRNSFLEFLKHRPELVNFLRIVSKEQTHAVYRDLNAKSLAMIMNAIKSPQTLTDGTVDNFSRLQRCLCQFIEHDRSERKRLASHDAEQLREEVRKVKLRRYIIIISGVITLAFVWLIINRSQLYSPKMGT